MGSQGTKPILEAVGGHRKKVSVIGGISGYLNSQRLSFDFATEPDGFYAVDKVVEYLRDRLKHLRGTVIVVCDRGGNHKGPVVREFLRRNRRLHLVMLPAWAPDHNPVEAVWSWLKYCELANVTPEDVPELDDIIIDRLIELKFTPELLKALWDRGELPFPKQDVQ